MPGRFREGDSGFDACQILKSRYGLYTFQVYEKMCVVSMLARFKERGMAHVPTRFKKGV